MKTILIFTIILTSLNTFGQSEILLEPDYACRACLEHPKLPSPDTLDCYPPTTKKWLDIVNTTFEKLYKKLATEEGNKLFGDQKRWELHMNVEFDQYNLIVADKEKPISQRRKVVITQTKIAKERALYLLNYLETVNKK
jgi:hypothetical protein